MRARILVIGGVQTNLDVIGGALRPFGFDVIEAHNAQEAYARAKEAPPAIVLCDVALQHDDDFDFIERINSDPELQAVPVLFITSTAARDR